MVATIIYAGKHLIATLCFFLISGANENGIGATAELVGSDAKAA